MITKKQALGSVTKKKSLTPKWFNTKGTNLKQAMQKATDINNNSVQTTPTVNVGATGTTVGSRSPQAPDQASVTRAVIGSRVGTPPPTGGNPPTAPTSVSPRAPGAPQYAPQSKTPLYAHAKKKLRGQGSFK